MGMAWYYYANISIEAPTDSLQIPHCQSHVEPKRPASGTPQNMDEAQRPKKARGHMVKRDRI